MVVVVSTTPPLPDPPGSFNPFNTQGVLPSLGPFHGAGRRRTLDRSVAAQERRDEAAIIAEMLVQGGLHPDDVYLTPEEVGETMLALDGSDLRDWLGRPRRAWAGYPDHAHVLKTRVGREYALFATAHGITRVNQVVIRPPVSTCRLASFADWHSYQSCILSEMLRYARKSRAPTLAWDLISAEITNVGEGGWIVDGHFHLTTRGADDDAFRRVQEYFEARGWTFWFTPADADNLSRHPAALTQYMGKGLAEAVVNTNNRWQPDALAELRRQTRHLALVRATGQFRRWKAEVVSNGLTAVEDHDGKPMLAPRRVIGERLLRKLRQSTSFIALRLCVHDFGDGLFRRSIRVRGSGQVTLDDVGTVYDLTQVTYSKGNTAILESDPLPPSASPCSPPPDPGGRSPPPSQRDDDVPW